MMAKFQKYDLVHELENFNGIMIGTSAGAMVQIREYHITKDLREILILYRIKYN